MRRFFLLLVSASLLKAQSGDTVLIVVNKKSPVSRDIGEYYRVRRAIPTRNVCSISTTTDEEISWEEYQDQIEKPIAECLQKSGLQESVVYIVTTMGVPLKVPGSGSGFQSEYASVDSELVLLYGKMRGTRFPRVGPMTNPLFMKRDAPVRHPQVPIYLVTRLAAYDVAEVKAMIDRGLVARNRGKFVVDLDSEDDRMGNNWLRTAAILLPIDRVVLEESSRVVYDLHDVIGYASWGSNDSHRKRRRLGFQFLPGAIATEYVSTNGRTMKRPPDDWSYTTWQDRFHFFAGSPQGLSADLIHEGATGASGNVYEPFLTGCARPDYLLPAYFQGRNLAESYYISLPFTSWQEIVLGDPLCSLGKP